MFWHAAARLFFSIIETRISAVRGEKTGSAAKFPAAKAARVWGVKSVAAVARYVIQRSTVNPFFNKAVFVVPDMCSPEMCNRGVFVEGSILAVSSARAAPSEAPFSTFAKPAVFAASPVAAPTHRQGNEKMSVISSWRRVAAALAEVRRIAWKAPCGRALSVRDIVVSGAIAQGYPKADRRCASLSDAALGRVNSMVLFTSRTFQLLVRRRRNQGDRADSDVFKM